MPVPDRVTALPVAGPSRTAAVVKWTGLAGFTAMIAGLFGAPETALRLLWFVLVPALPAVFLVNAELWRNVCPMATLNTLVSEDEGVPLGPRASRLAAVLGVALLLVAIPLRVVVFNESGWASGTLLAVTGVIALLSGIPFQRKAGFCNSVCPILPVERLYGQSPMMSVRNTRCTPCQICTRAACYDLNPGRSGLQIMGAGASRLPWVLLPFGLFALAFPGIIAGYSMASLQGAGVASIAVGGVVSWMLLSVSFALSRVGPAVGLLLAAALSGAAFYWFMPPAMTAALGWPSLATALLRVAGLGLVGVWTVRAFGRRRARSLARRSGSSGGSLAEEVRAAHSRERGS